MPPALHPRSIFTTSLFSTTLALSFIIVGLPHILPCPVDRNQYSEGRMEEYDAQGRRRVRRRKLSTFAKEDRTEQKGAVLAVPVTDGAIGARVGVKSGELQGQRETYSLEIKADSTRRNRECPVPKPGGVIGQLLGFKEQPQDDRRGDSVRVKVVEGVTKEVRKDDG